MILGLSVFSGIFLIAGPDPLDEAARVVLTRSISRLNYHEDQAVVELGLKQAEKLNLKYDLSEEGLLGDALFGVIENESMNSDYRTRAGNLLGNSLLMKHESLVDRAIAQLTPNQIEVAPPVPTSFSVSAVGTNSISLSWTSGGGSTARFYLKSALGASAPPDCASPEIQLPFTETSVTIENLTAASEYSFRLCSVSSTTMASSGVTLTSVWTGSTEVTELTTISETTAISLAWPRVEGAAYYRVVRNDGEAPPPEDCSSGTIVANGSSFFVRDSAVAPGRGYAYRICPIRSGEGDPLPTLWTVAWTYPANPSEPLATPSETSIQLAWTVALGATTYRIVRAQGATAPENCITETPLYEGENLSYLDEGLAAATEYSYRICSRSAHGDFSSGVTITSSTSATPEPEPTLYSVFRMGDEPPPDYQWQFRSGAAPTEAAVLQYIRTAKILPSLRLIELMKLYDRFDLALKTIAQITSDPGLCDFLIQKAESTSKMDLILGLDRLRAGDLAAAYLLKILTEKTPFDDRPSQARLTIEGSTHYGTLEALLQIIEHAPGEDSTKLAEALTKSFTKEIFDRDPRSTSLALKISKATGNRSEAIKIDYSYPKPKREELANRLKSAKSTLDRLWLDEATRARLIAMGFEF